MIRVISNRHRSIFPEFFRQMYGARAAVFHDRLGWEVIVESGLEVDSYDRDGDPIYLLAMDHRHEQATASLRLLPTTGPTMMKSEFANLFDEPLDIVSPTIWECTRFCIHPGGEPASGDAATELLLGLYNLCRICGIDGVVGIYDRRMTRVYSRIGWSPSPLAFRQVGKEGLLLGKWDVTPGATTKLRGHGKSCMPVIDFSLLPPEVPAAAITPDLSPATPLNC